VRFLVDTCLPPRLVTALAADGHDVEFAGAWRPDPGDARILQYADVQRRIVITLDSDYTTLAYKGAAHAGIIRMDRIHPSDFAPTVRLVIEMHREALQDGAVVIVDRNGMRVRRR
jgi:predicted nuclease of predicted toxin-antitoxin system